MRRQVGYTSYVQSFHHGYCSLCRKLVASSTDQKQSADETIRHMDKNHGIKADEFLGFVYEKINQ